MTHSEDRANGRGTKSQEVGRSQTHGVVGTTNSQRVATSSRMALQPASS